MPTHSYTPGDVIFPALPEYSAYTVAADTASGAYGADTAAHYLYLVNKVNAMDAILKARKVEKSTADA